MVITMKLLQKPEMMTWAEKTSRGHSFWLETLIFIAVFFVSQLIVGIITTPFTVIWAFSNLDAMSPSSNYSDMMNSMYDAMENMPSWLLVVNLFATIALILIPIIYCTKIEKRSLQTMGFIKKGAIKEYLVGLIIGAAMLAAAVGIGIAFGSITFNGISPDFALGIVIAFFLGYLVQGMSEEVICRGYYMVSLGRKYNVIIAIIANSVIFGALHFFNNGLSLLGIFNIILFGVFASVYMIKRGNIWGVAAIHSAWNFVQGNIFGVSVSGMAKTESLFSVTFSESGKLINGGDFGLEGGLAVTMVLVIGIVICLFIPAKRYSTDKIIDVNA